MALARTESSPASNRDDRRRSSNPGRRDARELVVELLVNWEGSRTYADQLLHGALAEAGLADSRDRGLVTDLFYGILRQLRLLDYLLQPRLNRPLEPVVRNSLRLGLYQLLFTRVPEHAAVDVAVNCAGPGRNLVNAVLRALLRDWAEVERAMRLASPAVRFSQPDFLVQRWKAQLEPAALQAFLEWNNTPPENYVRLNTLKNREFSFTELPDAEVLGDRTEMGVAVRHPLFRKVDSLPWDSLREGRVYAQDPSTAISCDLLAPVPGESVLDACAAPGGKTTYLAALMEGRGTLVATETVPERLELLNHNLHTLGADGVTRVLRHEWGAGKSCPDGAEGPFDAVLADVPCSNTGVLRRRVDARWRLDPAEFVAMARLQLGILRDLARVVRTGGGRLVYSTCSIDPEENIQVVERFLASPEGSGFELRAVRESLPWRDGMDGAYAALLIRV